MFNYQATRIKGRTVLGLPTRGRLDDSQKTTLDAYCKRDYVNYLVENGVISKTVGKVAYNASFPEGDENLVKRSTGYKKSKLHPNKYLAEGGHALERLLNLEFHDGVEEYIFEPVAMAARPADGSETRGRKPGSKNRDKVTVEAEKGAKAIRTEARKTLGLPPRGRLSDEQKDRLEKYVTEHTD